MSTQLTTARLAAKYGFTPSFVYQTLRGFSAELEGGALHGVRCETPTVTSVGLGVHRRGGQRVAVELARERLASGRHDGR